MSIKLAIITSLSIAAVVTTSAIAYGIQRGIMLVFISLPKESMQMFLVPILPTHKWPCHIPDRKNKEQPKKYLIN